MVATYEFLARAGDGGAVPVARARDVVSSVDGMVGDGEGFAWRVGDRVYMNVAIEGGDGGAVGVRFFLQYAMATRLADCREVALGIAADLGWELFDPQKGVVVTGAAARPRPWWRFW